MSQEDARRRFQRAVQALVEEPGSNKERLLVAWVSQLDRVDPKHDLPEQIVSPFEALQLRLSRYQRHGDIGNASSQIEAMSEAEAAGINGQIFSMFLTLHGLRAL